MRTSSALPHLTFGNGGSGNGSGNGGGGGFVGGSFFDPFFNSHTYNPTPAPPVPPTRHPVPKPTPYPTQSPIDHPTRAPVQAPYPVPSRAPVRAPVPAPVPTGPVTRKARHQFQWSSKTEGCFFYTPDVFLSCGDGGLIQVTGNTNAECEELNVDYVKCSTQDSGEDSYVDFSCIGIDAIHLTATAQMLPSEGVNCAKNYQELSTGDTTTTTIGGNAIIYGTLGRFCSNNAGTVVLNNRYGCTEGMSGRDGGVEFCYTGEQCSTERVCTEDYCTGEESCVALVDAISISNPDDRPGCSSVEHSIDLADYNFSPSMLASYHMVEWTYSDSAYDCDWTVPDVTLTCQNGGTIGMDHQNDFCQIDGDTITCTNPDPDSSEGRVSHHLQIWCYGQTDDQLVLYATAPAAEGARCESSGLAIQGVRLSRGCGMFGSEDFDLVTHPSFCDDPEQLHEGNHLCFGGNLCESSSSCSSITVPEVSADTAARAVGNCIYAI